MSDTATTPTSTSGTGAPPSGRGRRSWQSKRWQNNLWDTTPPSILVEEAHRLTAGRDRRQAARLLAVAAATTEDGQQRQLVLEQLAVTAADGGNHRISSETVFELQRVSPRNADLWVTFANVALSRGNYAHADSAARSALELDENHHGAWTALAASYAGLGWFDAAESCLDHIDRSSLTDLERWRIGRAVNRWALAGTRWVAAAAISVILVGVLSVAIASSLPFVAREYRLRQLRSAEITKSFGSMADSAWTQEKRLRAIHAVLVVASIAGFVASMTIL